MSKTKHAAIVCILACTSIYPSLTMAADSAVTRNPKGATAAKVPEAAPKVDASIGAITELSRQLKVAELQKQLREARTVPAPIAVQGGSIPSIGASPVGFAPPKLPVPVPAQAQPVIQSVSSVGGKYSAMSADGRPLAMGTQIMLGDAIWKVTGINAYSVAFEKCIGRKCTSANLAVGR